MGSQPRVATLAWGWGERKGQGAILVGGQQGGSPSAPCPGEDTRGETQTEELTGLVPGHICGR